MGNFDKGWVPGVQTENKISGGDFSVGIMVVASIALGFYGALTWGWSQY